MQYNEEDEDEDIDTIDAEDIRQLNDLLKWLFDYACFSHLVSN